MRPLAGGIAFVILFALLVRGGVAWRKIDAYSADPDAYRAIATTLAQSGTFGLTSAAGKVSPTSFRPPLYPWLLSWFVREGQLTNLWVAVLHVGLAALTAVCIFLAGRSLLGGAAGLIAAVFVIVDPILIQQSTLVMTETLAVTLMSIVIYAWVEFGSRAQIVRPRDPAETEDRFAATTRVVASIPAFTIALTLGLAFLCRPTFLVLAVLLAIACLIPQRFMRNRRSAATEHPNGGPYNAGRQRVWLAIMISTSMLFVISLWTIRNRKQLDAPIWATSHGGYTLLLANNSSFYDYLRHGDLGERWDADDFLIAYTHRYDGDPNTSEFWRHDWTGQPTSAVTFNEASDDKRCRDAALAVIRRQPGMFIWSCFVRVGRLWSPMPHLAAGRSPLSVTVVTAYYVTFYLLLAIGIWKLGKRVCGFSFWPILALTLALTAVHSVYWTNLRMRAPVIPGLALIVAAAFVPGRRVTQANADK